MRMLNQIPKISFPLCITAILISGHFNPFIHKMSAGLAVFSGMILSLIFTNPYEKLTKKTISLLLPWSIVGLGFGTNLMVIAKAGIHGIGYTVISILICAILGILLGKLLKNNRDSSVLITFGTAICGGSAIAAIAPTIKAKHHAISVSLATIFTLNAISLFIFPAIGHAIQLTQEQFGLWCALAIHDTSSVVGATLQYGPQALEIGTTVKLARALWIVPVALIISFVYTHFTSKKNTDKHTHAKKPWFILGFLFAAAIATWIPAVKTQSIYIRNIAEQTLIVTLFCIGTSLSRSMIKEVGIKPFIQGVVLWLAMATLTLVAIRYNYVSL